MGHPVYQTQFRSSNVPTNWAAVDAADEEQEERLLDVVVAVDLGRDGAGGNCIKIGLPGKLILSKRKGLREVIFS